MTQYWRLFEIRKVGHSFVQHGYEGRLTRDCVTRYELYGIERVCRRS